MVTVELGFTKSTANVVDKDFEIINTQAGTLRAGTSILDPVITIQCDNSEVWRNRCNYCHVVEFDRYYYITDIISRNGAIESANWPSPGQLWDFHMHVDVLKTYSEEIKLQRAIVARQENSYNLMLDDGTFMVYQNPKLQTKLFSVADPFETQEFVLIVAGS